MDKSTFEKAQALSVRMQEISAALSQLRGVQADKMGPDNYLVLSHKEDLQALKQHVEKFLKARREKLEKEFGALK